MFPMSSVSNMQEFLYELGYRSVNETYVDWHYLSKLMYKVRTDVLRKMSVETRVERLSIIKESHKSITAMLGQIVSCDRSLGSIMKITTRDRISAAALILKSNIAMFYVEENLGLLKNSKTSKGAFQLAGSKNKYIPMFTKVESNN